MVAEEIVVCLSGGAPWGFRLQGGVEQQKPLQVAKVRRRSKACRAGLREHDELIAIGDQMCADLTHAQAMSIIDEETSTLNLKVRRNLSGFTSSSCAARCTSPRSSIKVLSPPATLLNNSSSFLSPTELSRGVTSPPDSEAYYGETDSDADTHSQTHHRRQRRPSPHARSPSRYDNQEEETSEMSGYESATDTGFTTQWHVQGLTGVPRRELIYLPHQYERNTSAHTLTPRTLTPTPDQSPVDVEGEGDSGFQETGGCTAPACPPLVSPERAKEALKLGSGHHLVPMVGPQLTPVNDELYTTYMHKARQAKLQRGESVVEKQVKEARTKCRSIASLLTDAPNPNSKGVLMFKKRRQRAKKYTLTCFGKAEGDRGETEGETGGETEEEGGGSSILSGSEVEEEGLSGSFDSTWDSGYLDLLDRRSSACPSTTPTTPTTASTNHSAAVDLSAYLTPERLTSGNQSSGLDISGLVSSASDSFTKQPISNQMSPPAVALTNGGSVAVSRASVVLSPPSETPIQSQNGLQNNSDNTASIDLISNSSFNPNPSILNRTARPFTPGSTPSRASVTSVMFRPPQPKPTPLTMAPKPVLAVSMMTVPPTQPPPGPDERRAVSSTSLYIPVRNNNSNTSPSIYPPPSARLLSFSPPSTFPSLPAVNASSSSLLSPTTDQNSLIHPSTAKPISPPSHLSPPASITFTSAPHISSLNPSFDLAKDSFPVPPLTQPSPSPSVHPSINPTDAVSSTLPPQAPAHDSMATREQRISVPAARTGILHDARCRSSKKPMFSALQSKDVSPNPDLLSMVQNMDDHCGRAPCVESVVAPGGEAGHESGPEEDWLRLGAEACNFMQTQRGPKPPAVAPKPQTPQVMQLAGKGGQLFARRQNRMDRYVVERSPSVAVAPYSPAQTREPSPTPSLPAAWKYSPNIRAPPPINYNPLLSPSCPPKAQKKLEVAKSGTTKSKGKKAGIKPVDIMSYQPYQLNSSLFSYGGGIPQDLSNTNQQRGGLQKTARVYEVKRFSTPPPTATGPTPKVIVPRSATTLGEPLRYTDEFTPPTTGGVLHEHHQTLHQPIQPQWASSPLSSPLPPAPTAPLPQLPTLSSPPVSIPAQPPSFSQLQPPVAPHSNRSFKSAPDLSPLGPSNASHRSSTSYQSPSSSQPPRVPRPRFSTSNLGLQPCIWRPGSTTN
ncbi:synaptopodin 2-like protein [Girardinichthys multiradiatus]|uniref:synaptopodin 2-like protein n=1 Tax=Girardinichthys multiradiatus TaxID=208333 RepID=UPI001FAE0EC7|nr:synaptopodin 2-like protein [Girardinichthys multiradiatus]